MELLKSLLIWTEQSSDFSYYISFFVQLRSGRPSIWLKQVI